MIELLLGLVAFVVLNVWFFQKAPRGPIPIGKPTPVDDAFIHATVRTPGPHGFKAGLMQPTRDDVVVDLASRRRARS